MNETQCRLIVSERSGGMCEKCGQAPAHEKHHRRNRSQGGRYTPANIVDLCNGCHGWITRNPTGANAEGWTLLNDDPDPTKVPIRHPKITWARVKLDDLGMFSPCP